MLASYSKDLSQSLDSGVHSFFNDNATATYTHEPEYTEQELKTLPLNDSSEDDSSDDDDELYSSRKENLH